MIQNEPGSPFRRVLAHPGPVDDRLAGLLAAAGITMVACQSGEDLRGEVTTGAGALLVDAEALACPEMADLPQDFPRPACGADLPLLVLARPGSSAMAIARAWAAAGDLTVLDPSAPPALLASALRAAVGARERRREATGLAQARRAECDALRALAEHTEAHLAYLDLEFRFVEVNAAYARGCGRRREELLGRRHFELFPHPDNQRIFETVRDTAEAARFRAKPFEFPNDPARGTTYWDWTLAPVHGSGGRLAGLVLSLLDVTDQWRGEQAVRASEHRFRRLAETSPVGLVIGDVRGGLSYLNPAAQAMLGYTEAEVAAGHLRWDELTPPEYAALDILAVGELQETGSCRPYEKAYLARDGKRVPILVGAAVLDRAPDGEPAVAAFVTDLRPLRRAEDALRASEERLLLAIEAAGLGTWELRPTTGTLIWSDRCKSLWGLPRDTELSYPVFLSQVHPQDRGQVHRVAQEALDPEGSGRYENEYRIVRPDGEVRWLATRGQAFFEDGPEGRRAVRMVGINLDVTDRRAAEEARRERDGLYRSMFENNHAPMLLLDPDTGEIADANSAAASFYGYAREELRRKRITDLNQLTWEEVQATMGLARRQARRFFDFRHRLATGEARDVEVFSGPVRVGGRELLYSIVVDVTERKRAKEAFRESAAKEKARAAELRAIMEAVPAAVWIAHDPGCRLITGNRAADEVLRLDPGRNASRSAPNDELPAHFRVCRNGVELAPEDLPVQAATRGREVRGFDEEIVFEDGSRRHLYGNATPLLDDDGQPRGAVAAFLDITNRVAMEGEVPAPRRRPRRPTGPRATSWPR